MAGVTPLRSPVEEPLPAFASSWDHLEAELRYLDLRLYQEMLRQPHQSTGDALSVFKGLLITHAEAAELLTRPAGQEPANDVGAAEDDVQQRVAQSLADLKNEIEERRSASRQRGLYLSLARLTELFLLNRFEEECLVVCLAPEVDRKYEKLYAYLQDDATRKKPGVDLLLNLLCKTLTQRLAAQAALDPSAPLFKFKLLQLTDNSAEGQPPLRARTLKLDDRIVNFLLGHRQLDARVERFARIVVPQADAANAMVAQEFYQRADRFLHAYFKEQQSAGRNVLLYLHGPVNSDQRSAVEAICRSYDLPLLVACENSYKAVYKN